MRTGWSGERGQTAAEYLGVLLVVSVIIAAIASSNVGGAISGALTAQVCKVAGGSDAGCGERRSGRDRRREEGPARRPADVTARAASIPCDGMTARECSALRAMMGRAQAEHQHVVEAWIRYAADFATWVATAEGIANVADVIYRPGLVKAVNALIRKDVNREGARLLTAVKNQKLWNIVESNYRYGATIGKGSTADALRDEVARGVQYGVKKTHYIKAQDTINGLNKLLTRGTLTNRERQIATNMRGELWTALPARYRPPLQ
jgi:pilus assembly protein Flp/PilA